MEEEDEEGREGRALAGVREEEWEVSGISHSPLAWQV